MGEWSDNGVRRGSHGGTSQRSGHGIGRAARQMSIYLILIAICDEK